MLYFELLDIDDIQGFGVPEHIAQVDADKLKYPLTVRRWQEARYAYAANMPETAYLSEINDEYEYRGNLGKPRLVPWREQLQRYVGNNFQGGYSDHFPVYIYIGK